MKERDTYKESLERANKSITMKSQELTQKIEEVDKLKKKYEIALSKMENQNMTEKIIKKKIYKTKSKVQSTTQDYVN